MKNTRKWIRIHPEDTVAVALAALPAGTRIAIGEEALQLAEAIPQGHKFSLVPIADGEEVIKYGLPIGRAAADILPGMHVHTHNLRTGLGEKQTYRWKGSAGKQTHQWEDPAGKTGGKSLETACESSPEATSENASACTLTDGSGGIPLHDGGGTPLHDGGDIPMHDGGAVFSENEMSPRFFLGYRRTDGRVGVRNEVWIIPTVGCMNDVAAAICARVRESGIPGGVDRVVSFRHPYGCSQMGRDQENTKRILADLARHPNAGGVLLLSLGCENCGLDRIRPFLGDFDESRIRFLTAQECGDEVADGARIAAELCVQAANDRRKEIPVSELVVGLKCGGSDGLSGITANPVVGAASDRIVSAGGSTILTEVPEMFGAETLLMARAADEGVFQKIVALINGFKDYFTQNHQTIYENPSPGNKAGGISTLEDKALGCTQKSGSAPVMDVLDYGQALTVKGLNLLCAPGNDLVASTALAASGAQIILFTTGRGTPFAAPVPTLKIASNTDLANRKPHWIDFNCGVLAEDEDIAVPELGEELYRKVLAVASGERVRAEEAGYCDLAIFKQGVTL